MRPRFFQEQIHLTPNFMPTDPAALPPATVANVVSLNDTDCGAFDLTLLGFPQGAKLRGLRLTSQVAAVWLDVTAIPPGSKVSALYPGIRRLARGLDEDTKQMGLVVPVVVVVQPSASIDDKTRREWLQADADTETNAGEFSLRMPFNPQVEVVESKDEDVEAFLKDMLLADFKPRGLSLAIEPRTEEDYRGALLESSDESRSAMHTYLLRDCLYPNWETPEKIGELLAEISNGLASDRNVGGTKQ